MKGLAVGLILAAACVAQTSSTGGDPIAAGRKRFQIRCAGCHGADGAGGERAPGIGHGDRANLENEGNLKELIRKGIPESGMPAFPLPEPELQVLAAFVRSRVVPASQSAVSGDSKAGESYFLRRRQVLDVPHDARARRVAGSRPDRRRRPSHAWRNSREAC